MILAHHLIQKCVAGAEVRWKDCVLICWPAALHLQRQLKVLTADNMTDICWQACGNAGRCREGVKVHTGRSQPRTPETLCAGCAQQCSM